MEGVGGPRSDRMEEVGGSYELPSPSFSSCIHEMRQKEYIKGTNHTHTHTHSYHPITRTCPLCAPVGGSQALLPLSLPPLSSLSCNLAPLLHLFLPSTLVSWILVVPLLFPERDNDTLKNLSCDLIPDTDQMWWYNHYITQKHHCCLEIIKVTQHSPCARGSSVDSQHPLKSGQTQPTWSYAVPPEMCSWPPALGRVSTRPPQG